MEQDMVEGRQLEGIKCSVCKRYQLSWEGRWLGKKRTGQQSWSERFGSRQKGDQVWHQRTLLEQKQREQWSSKGSGQSGTQMSLGSRALKQCGENRFGAPSVCLPLPCYSVSLYANPLFLKILINIQYIYGDNDYLFLRMCESLFVP